MNRLSAILLIGLLSPFTNADIQIDGQATALVGIFPDEDRQVLNLSTAAVSSGIVNAAIAGASASLTVNLTSSGPNASVHVQHALDSGPDAIAGSSSDGTFTFTVPAGTHFEFTGILEQSSTNPSPGGPFVRIVGPGGTAYSANANFSLPNRPLDFSAIISSGDLFFAGTYEFSWFHAANITFTHDQTISTADFTITLTLPGCNPADFNSDGVLDFFDISAFLTAFTAHDPAADFTEDGAFDFFDIAAFLSEFAAGCP